MGRPRNQQRNQQARGQTSNANWVDESPYIDKSVELEPQKLDAVDEIKEKKVGGLKISGSQQAMASATSRTIEQYLKDKYNVEEDNYDVRLTHVISGMKNYINEMRAGVPQNPESGKRNQFQFLQIIRFALMGEANVSRMCFDTILYLANQNSENLFNEAMIARFGNLLSPTDCAPFANLAALILQAKSPRNRHNVTKHISLERVCESLNNDEQRRNLIGFFKMA